jgi:hypothetical protein
MAQKPFLPICITLGEASLEYYFCIFNLYTNDIVTQQDLG